MKKYNPDIRHIGTPSVIILRHTIFLGNLENYIVYTFPNNILYGICNSISFVLAVIKKNITLGKMNMIQYEWHQGVLYELYEG